MRQEWCKHEGDSVLLVEGQNDCHVVLALCKARTIPQTFGIYECENDKKALQRLNALIASENPPRIVGLMIDADNPSLAGRWASIQSKLAQYPYSFPKIPEANGTIIAAPSDLPRLGFWLMPDNRLDGMLEDFCNAMISTDDSAVVEQCLQIATASGCAKFKPVHRSKAFVHTYLAWQDEPGKALGQAITAKCLDSDTTTANAFVQWLIDLFADSP